MTCVGLQPYDAAPPFMYAWSLWRQENGAMASLAVSRVLISDPDCTAADMVLAAIGSGIDPRSIPTVSSADFVAAAEPVREVT